MIAHVYGNIAEKFTGSVIVDVAGVGYEIKVPTPEYDGVVLGENVKFYTYHHITDRSQELFGFSSLASKKIFELLITVQGVGPKAAIAVLSLGDNEQVRNAIACEDIKFIQKANGVGAKAASRIILDLKDKVGVATSFSQTEKTTNIVTVDNEALEALIALGYSLADASKALEGVSKDLPASEQVREALKTGINF